MLAVTVVDPASLKPVGTASNPTYIATASTISASVTPVVTASTYAANVVLGGIMAFNNILPPSYNAVIESITLTFKGSVQTVWFNVSLFSAPPTGTFTDTSTAAIALTDSAALLGIYQLTVAYSPLGTHTIYTLDGIGKALRGTSQNLYAVVTPTATTAALGSASDMTLTFGVLQG